MLNTEKIKDLLDKGDKIAVTAKKIGVNRSYLYDIRNGKTNIGSDLLQKLADYFEVPVGYFFDEENLVDDNSKDKIMELEYEIRALRKEIEFLNKEIEFQKKLNKKNEEIISLLKTELTPKNVDEDHSQVG